MADISLKSANIIEYGDFHVTNAVLGGILETVLLLILIFFVTKNAKLIPGRVQLMCEMIITMFQEFLESAYGSKRRARKFLPFFVTLFLFLIVANQVSIVPLVSNIVTGEGDLLFRISTADYSQTVALGIISIVGAHIIAFTISPVKHIGNFIKIAPFFRIRSFGDFFNACLEFFLGILDIIGEFAKFMSISSRLFGNIFAGDVMVVVISGITAWTGYILPIPFLGLGIFSGFVQAFVFTILSLNFMAGTVNAVNEANKEESEKEELTLNKAKA